MKTKTTDYADIHSKILKLSLKENTGLMFMPYNFGTVNTVQEFIYDDSLKVVNKLFKQNSISIDRLEQDITKTKYYQENDITWIGPTIFVAYSFWTENSNLIAIGLSVIANYLTDFFKGKSSSPKIKINYVLEKDPKKGIKNIHFSYEGDIEGLNKIPEILKSLKDE